VLWLNKDFRNVKIPTKFNIILTIIFILGIFLSGTALAQVLQHRAEEELTSKGMVLFTTMNSVRDYTQQHINPLLAPKLETESAFIPEAIPTFSVREVFENIRSNEEYRNFFYKDATPNPTNLRDKADGFETQLLKEFRTHPQIKQRSDFRSLPEGKVFYIARPFAIQEQKCLQCHSTPEMAPKSLLTSYGSEHGFGWKLNEIVAVQILYVPAEEIFESVRRSFSLVMGVIIGIFVIVISTINLLLRKTVIQRIRKIAKIAQEVSTGNMTADFTEKSQDEIGALAVAFNRMKSSLEISMKLLSRKK
jgi:HAMP domain-containing protein